MRSYKVSIVIPTYNTWNLTQSLLGDLEAHEADNIDDVLIVDDASTEQPTMRSSLNFYIARLSENAGFPFACNVGLKTVTHTLAERKLVFLISNDVQVSGRFIQQAADILFDARRALVGNRHIVFDSGWNKFDGVVFDYLEGWFYGATSDGWRDLGYFDEAYSPYDYEDIDLCTTAKRKGYKLVSLNNPHIKHLGGQTIGFNPARELITKRNREYFRNKWLP